MCKLQWGSRCCPVYHKYHKYANKINNVNNSRKQTDKTETPITNLKTKNNLNNIAKELVGKSEDKIVTIFKKHISVDTAKTQIEKAQTAPEATKPKPKQQAEPNRNVPRHRPAEPRLPFPFRFIEDN